MKYKIILPILLLPCLAAFNESESILPNIFGLTYMFALYFASKTTPGKRFVRKLYKACASGFVRK